MAGVLIAIEGIDYAGKTTQAALLRGTLESRGYAVNCFSSPDARTEVGALLRRALRGEYRIPVHALFALFSVNRMEQREAIEQALVSGQIAVSDRYSQSEYAYGVASGLPRDWLAALESQMPVADLVILLDLPPDVALGRASSDVRLDKFELDKEFLSHVRQQYLELARSQLQRGERWETIDASQTVEAVNHAIERGVLRFLHQRSREAVKERRDPPGRG